ncbi:uncharacterized protein LOC143299566 isoform X8 [Babylonia areolata]|uniref:uncharacterized protein LOC143299566 isoform X8 n=1 Tax=Babylonia areolata TaxID=304850 RepID=UPI003FCF4D49
MEKLDEDSAAKFINALIKSLQTLCHGYLNFDNGIEIVGHINLNVDKGSSMHYILEEKVCKNEENSTLFISNSFHAQNQNSKSKGKDSDTVGNRNEEKTSSADLGQAGKLSAISSISSALSKSHEKNRSGSTSSAKDSENLHSKPLSSTAKRKASDDYTNDVRAAKQAQLCSSPSPVSHFLSQSPHDPSGSSSPVDTKPSLRQLHGDESSGTVLPQTAAVSSDNAGDLGVNLVGSVLERVDDQSNSDLQDRGDDSDGDLEVTFIKEEYVEGEQSACQFENSGGQQYGRGTLQRASSSDMSDGSMYPVSLHHSQSASSTFVPSSHDLATAQHYGPSTSSQPQPGTSGIRGAYPPESHDSSACDQKILEATQLFKGNLSQHQPPQPVPAGLKPGCGYVHPSDAQKWMMYELVPGSGVFIHEENYHNVMSKQRDGHPDGKAMARYLMSCFWKQADLVGASIAEPPRPHHRSLDKGIINAILDFCETTSHDPRSYVRRAMWNKISSATFFERQKNARPRAVAYQYRCPSFQ